MNDKTEDPIEKAKFALAEARHALAQMTGDPQDYYAAADLFDRCDGREAEQKAKLCRKAARLLEVVE
jgi:hypothetical protein